MFNLLAVNVDSNTVENLLDKCTSRSILLVTLLRWTAHLFSHYVRGGGLSLNSRSPQDKVTRNINAQSVESLGVGVNSTYLLEFQILP